MFSSTARRNFKYLAKRICQQRLCSTTENAAYVRMADAAADANNNDAAAPNDGGVDNLQIREDMILPTVSRSKLCNDGMIIKAVDCMEENQHGTIFNSERNVLKGVLLSIKHGSTAKLPAKGFISVQQNAQGGKRQKVSFQLQYNRLAMFGDLNDPPNCFAVLTESGDESNMVFDAMSKSNIIGIGGVYYILEPRVTNKMLAKNTPIITTKLTILPLMLSKPEVTIEANLPEQRIWTHLEPGPEYYFVLHEVPVEFNYFSLCTKDVSCNGRLCDRSLPLQKAGSCPCFYTGAVKGLVAEYNIIIPAPLELSGKDRHPVEECRSLRTTEIFFENVNEFSKKDDIVEERFRNMRAAVRAMQQHVNANGGWTVVGWYKKGEVDDQATPGEKIDSLNWTFHISLLVPTSSYIRNGLDDAFNGMRIKLAAPFAVAENPHNH